MVKAIDVTIQHSHFQVPNPNLNFQTSDSELTIIRTLVHHNLGPWDEDLKGEILLCPVTLTQPHWSNSKVSQCLPSLTEPHKPSTCDLGVPEPLQSEFPLPSLFCWTLFLLF